MSDLLATTSLRRLLREMTYLRPNVPCTACSTVPLRMISAVPVYFPPAHRELRSLRKHPAGTVLRWRYG